ncbi:hypothetical protein B0H63DRAFT_497720 [Podospora didyma]|uniref:Conidiation-specific protein 13 n=1 Tax=Podospora didyma TaxID=330526 RepID=A0AAE0N2F2_9PEZI|nr:hypothetical protein B0H63DRAFT_497720 [Podospora didyma]
MHASQILIALLVSGIPSTLAATIPGSFISRSSAPELSKLAIQPPFSEKDQNVDLQADLPTRPWRYETWPQFWIPKSCREEADVNKLNPTEFEVRDIWYEDCAAAWTVCRHGRAIESWDSILTTLGQVPVGMRQHVSNVLILPGRADAISSAAAYTRGSVLVFAPSFFKLGVLVHEFTHILDMVSLQSVVRANGYAEGTPFSRTKMWTSAYGNDTNVPTPYSRITWQEDFADAGRWAMSDMTHRGGLAAYSAGWTGCRHQIAAYKAVLGNLIFPGSGRCFGKIDTSRPVPVVLSNGDKDETVLAAAEAKKPVGNLVGTGVESIVLPPGAEDMLFVHRGAGANEVRTYLPS